MSSILSSYQLQAQIYARPSVCGEWRFGHLDGDLGGATFHLVGRGQGWLHMKQLAAPVALRGGDLVLLPRNDWHLIAASADPDGLDERLDPHAGGPVSSFLCGSIRIVSGGRNPIMNALPDLILVRAEQGGVRLESLGRLMAAEAEACAFGHEIALDKLADVPSGYCRPRRSRLLT